MPEAARHPREVEHVDVLIVGAGLSGIGAACHLRRECPTKSLAILEARDAIGGTWDLFRYPGIRSDSDMFTLGYAFRPWTSPKAIADGPSILAYVRDTAQAYGVDRLVRYGVRVVRAAWCSETARWTVTARRTDPGSAETTETTMTCGFLSVCSGYYRYDEGFTPTFPGREEFTGQIVHPQHWPKDLDYADQRVVVIGSGATTVTLVPKLAERAAHVTMLQRSPTYIAAVSSRDHTADRLRGRVPTGVAYRLVRWKNVLTSIAIFQLSRRRPETMKALLRKGVVAKLPVDFDVDTHLAPTYNPWDQRLCAAPDGDIFRAISAGRADIVTDRIERFTPTGIRLGSGAELPADVVVTATGLNLMVIGGMALVVDGRPVEPADTLAYKGMMLSGVPNFSLTLGYTNASWTLKADLVARYVCRLLTHLDRRGYASVTPVVPTGLHRRGLQPLIDLQAGYVLRSVDALPKQGPRAPWRLHQNYVRDVLLMRFGPLADGVRFTRAMTIPAAERNHHDRLPVR
ncbi:MAG: flavin-containing monooxygenase [Propionibacteriaceae bacterium]